jgi:hypothetical protein
LFLFNLKFVFTINFLNMAFIRVASAMDLAQEEDFPRSMLLLRGSRTPEERFTGAPFLREVN